MSTQSIVIKWGLIGGMVSIIIGLITYLLGLSDSNYFKYLGIIAMVAVVILGLFEYRDKLNGGFASFSDLFKVGLLIGLLITVISSIWSLIYMNFIDTEMISNILLQTEINLESKGMSDKEIKQAMEITKKFMTPISMFIMGFASSLLVSGLVSLVSAIVIKNPKPFASLEE